MLYAGKPHIMVPGTDTAGKEAVCSPGMPGRRQVALPACRERAQCHLPAGAGNNGPAGNRNAEFNFL